eukprot:CAMPEP_0205904764 /NCGR_PEP_ID=MMETSP1325-20131115/929_1 /ASSEMBLY_ACC=CAM_ASM_000708 /TAXON_ID=236786 /ORGANISM="Florenciella sp., Strain RCC1007" /LENGTH=213 /DNA_ID=CAMNT_0053270591 /DNA_START=73 /DNA_END=715 /DNA_ORIENTATION=+
MALPLVDPTPWKAAFQILNLLAWVLALTLMRKREDAVLVVNSIWYGSACFFFFVNPSAAMPWVASGAYKKEHMYAKTKGAMGFLGVGMLFLSITPSCLTLSPMHHNGYRRPTVKAMNFALVLLSVFFGRGMNAGHFGALRGLAGKETEVMAALTPHLPTNRARGGALHDIFGPECWTPKPIHRQRPLIFVFVRPDHRTDARGEAGSALVWTCA